MNDQKQIDLKGCTFEGDQITGTHRGKRESHSDIRETRRKEINGRVILLKKRFAPGRLPKSREDYSSRTRHLTPDEIRKEYGLMKKPYQTYAENIIYLIINEGPIDLRGISDQLGFKDPQVGARKLSGPCSNVYKRLGVEGGKGYFTREMKDHRYFYSVVDFFKNELFVPKLYDEYLQSGREEAQKKRAADRGEIPDPAADVKQEDDGDLVDAEFNQTTDEFYKPEGVPQGAQQYINSLQQTIKQMIEDEAKKNFGVDVQVSGKVEILFGWKK